MVILLVSGGHTMLISMDEHLSYRVLGQTLDDAAGEYYDKVARYLGLVYPGGPIIDKLAGSGKPEIKFPRPMLGEGCDFSFSGLKTAVINFVRKHPDVSDENIAASFQEAVVEVLVTKTIRAAKEQNAVGVCIGGGVAANSRLREAISDACQKEKLKAFIPSRSYCTDNAAMIGAAAWRRYQNDGPSNLATGADPNLRIPE